MSNSRTIACPKCKTKASLDQSNKWRPFCSQRCKDGDFIDWSNEEHRIAGQDNLCDVMTDELDKGY